MHTMTKIKTVGRALVGALFLVAFSAAALAAGEKPSFLTGKVTDLGGSGSTLEKRAAAAGTEFRRTAAGTIYFTAYEFMSRHKIHRGNMERPADGYVVNVKETKIKIEEKSRGRNEVGTEIKDTPSPAALLFLHDPADKGRVLDVTVLDVDQTYDFSEAPVYWLGRADNAESVTLLEKCYAEAHDDARAQKSLLFAASCHQGPQGYLFLKKAALGPSDDKVRETAIFWLGNYGDAQSLADLKDIYGREKSLSVKKQVIFALQLSKQKEAVEELIRIAKQDVNAEARKQAVFWLGQKASAESVKALKDIVDAAGEADPLKEQAIFAISQMPKDRSVPMLIDIAKTNKSPAARKRALFWLGQSGDPAALKLFEEILLKK
jgi:HEAT repeat protein